MKIIKVLLLLFVVTVFVSVMVPRCEAQNPAPNLIVSFITCSPSSCLDLKAAQFGLEQFNGS